MPVQSMTGFARFEGETADGGFVWELRSVNGKNLDLRLRLPQGWEAIEPELRKAAGARLARGNVQVSLQMRRSDDAPVFTINEVMLAQMLALTSRLVADGHAAPPTADGILTIKGIVEVADMAPTPEQQTARQREVVGGFAAAIDRLVATREEEGAALRIVLEQRLDEIEALVDRAEADPSRGTEAIRERLATQVRDLLQAEEKLDEQRLHQEAALLAARADIREELDRLRAHVAATRNLLVEGGPIGRRLDFLSQEFNRESNTVCSKSNSTTLTVVGLDLKVVVDQFREQVQNLE